MLLIGLATSLPSPGSSAVGWCVWHGFHGGCVYWVWISIILMVGVLLCRYGSWRYT